MVNKQKDKLKQICLLGSTGSIGINSLDVIERNSDRFRPLYLTAHRNIRKLVQQARRFKPRGVVIAEKGLYPELKKRLTGFCAVEAGMDGIISAIEDPDVDIVLNGLVGAVGVVPTCRAIDAGKDVAIANKETLVMAGQLVTAAARNRDVRLLPIDSEHSAIWQCLQGESPERVRRILLTASGGPFRTWPASRLKKVTVEEALHHPNWQMGAKITIDSATLMNKGLEVIEAFWLYPVTRDQIEVVVHPQSIIHSMVEFDDGSIKAQLGIPDMRIPIQYALTYPERLPLEVDSLSFKQLKELTFESPNLKKFPCLSLACQALKQGGTAPAVMNVANEVAVQRFLDRQIGFTDIPVVIEKTWQAHPYKDVFALEDILELEKWATEYAASLKM